MTFALSIMAAPSYAQDVSPYIGGDLKLTEAPNGAVVREDVLAIAPKISYYGSMAHWSHSSAKSGNWVILN